MAGGEGDEDAREPEAAPTAPAAPQAKPSLVPIVLAALVLVAVFSWFFWDRRQESLATSRWLGEQFQRVRSDQATLEREVAASPDAARAASYRAIAESRSETFPTLFEFDSRGTYDVLACANVVLHGARDQGLAVIVAEDKREQTREIRALSLTRRCFCDPDLASRCSFR